MQTVLRYYPEIWIDYADTVVSVRTRVQRLVAAHSSPQYKMMRQSAGTKDLAHDGKLWQMLLPLPRCSTDAIFFCAAAARKVWLQALDALPASPLVHFAFSAFLEAAGALDEAASVFDMMLERDFVSTENKQLALIQVRAIAIACAVRCRSLAQQILFVRRTKGMQDARLHSVRAFKSPYASWQLVSWLLLSFALRAHALSRAVCGGGAHGALCQPRRHSGSQSV